MRYSLRYAAISDVGKVRKNNQDSGYASPNMLIVADGMGGAAAGDLASTIAIKEFSRADERLASDQMIERFSWLISQAGDKITDLVSNDISLEGMGTTVCGAFFSGTQIAIGNLGDSRGYLLRDGELSQLTHDHSWVQSLIDEGKLTPEQAKVHPHRSLVLRVLNGQPNQEGDYQLLDVKLGDRILFCSDGLSGMIDDRQIAELATNESLDEVIANLVNAANNAGGQDNITVVLGEIVAQDELLDVAEPVVVGAAKNKTIPNIADDSAGSDKAIGYPNPEIKEEDTDTDEEDDAQEESSRYAPTSNKNRWLGTAFISLIIVVVLVAGAWGWLQYTKSRVYVGQSGEYVAIYHGIPGRILGISLNELSEVQPTKVDDLPKYYQSKVRETIEVKDMDSAYATARELKTKADKCIQLKTAKKTPLIPKPSVPTSPQSSFSSVPTASPTKQDELEGC